MYQSLSNLPTLKNFYKNKKKVLSEKNFGEDLGIVKAKKIKKNEIKIFRNLVFKKITKNLKDHKLFLNKKFTSKNIENYHKYVDDKIQKICLSKQGRILDKKSINKIRSMDFFKNLKKIFGNYKISDEEKIGYENICFRLVRPFKKNDVGSIHADGWFWDYHKTYKPNNLNRVKIWFSICGDPNKSGLLFVPNSHKKKFVYQVIQNKNKLNFKLKKKIRDEQLAMFKENHGTPVLFNNSTLHVGSLNKSNKTRASIELTILYKVK